jgi:hypothetical protein
MLADERPRARPGASLAWRDGSQAAPGEGRSWRARELSFADMRRLVEAFGFELRRWTSGSHHVSVHRAVRELLNLQDARGQAKPYQIRQFLRLVEQYALTMEDEG